MVAEAESLDSIQERKLDGTECHDGEQVGPARRSNTAATNSGNVETMGNSECTIDVISSGKKVAAQQKSYNQQMQGERKRNEMKIKKNDKSNHFQANSQLKYFETSRQSNELNNTLVAKSTNTCLESQEGDRDTLDKSNLPLSSALLTTTKLIAHEVPEKRSLSKSDMEVSLVADSSTQKLDSVHTSSNSVKLKSMNDSSKKYKETPSPKPISQTASITQVTTSATPTNEKIEESTSDEEAKQARLPLVSRYGSFIHPTDTSLAEARRRLRVAIDQTRRLRIAFTERVYEKYRVILYPPPSHIDKIVDKIIPNPAEIHSKLQQQIQDLKAEKEVEKKEAQRLTAAGVFNNSNSDGKPASSPSVETAEQLAYIGAGLSLVILPEQVIKDPEIDLGKFQHRGPTNPETGQRVSGISQAAAAAAEVLLDRVRRAMTLRSERQRRQQLSSENKPGSANETNIDNMLSHYSLLSAVFPSASSKIKVSEREHHVIVDHSSTYSKKPSKGPGISQQILKKHSRTPIQVGITGTSMLTLEPLVEDLDSGGKLSSSTAGLILCGAGCRSNQSKWKSENATFNDGRRQGIASNTKKLGDSSKLQPGLGPDSNGESSTSQLDKNSEEKVIFPVMDRETVTTIRAKKAVELMLSQFVSKDDGEAFVTKLDSKSEPDELELSIHNVSTRKRKDKCRARRATEIGLMHGLQHSIQSKDKSNNSHVDFDQHCSITENPPTKPRALQELVHKADIEPIVTFSVLQAVGLITDTPTSQKEIQPLVSERLHNVNPSRLESVPQNQPCSSEQLLSIYSKAISKKRTFTEAFASKSNNELGNILPKSRHLHERGTELIPTLDVVVAKEEKIQKGVSQSSREKQDKCPVVSMRGGGGNDGSMGNAQEILEKKSSVGFPRFEKVEESCNKEESSARPKSAPDTTNSPPRTVNVSRPSSSSSAPIHSSSTDGIYSVLAQNRVNNGSTYPQQGNGHFGLAPGAVGRHGVTDRIQAQAHHLQLQAAAMNGLSQGGEINDFFSTNLNQRSGLTGRSNWSAVPQTRQNAVNLLPSHSSLALGINPHQAAMLELSARDRAARALLAREQQAAIHVAAVHRQQQQAAALMTAQASQAGAGIFSTSSAARYNQLGPHSAATAAAILSSPAAAALIGQTQLGSGTLSGPMIVSQHSDSRPSSQHSTSSNKSGKGKRSSPKGRKETCDQSPAAKADSTEAMKDQAQPKSSVTLSKRKAADLSVPIDHEESRTAKVALPKEAQWKKLKPNSNGEIRISLTTCSEPNTAKTMQAKTSLLKESKQLESSGQNVHNKMPGTVKASVDAVIVEEPSPGTQSPKTETSTPGMQFILPPIPPNLDSKLTSCVLEGRIHNALRALLESSDNLGSAAVVTSMLDYLQAVGSSVPIPKALISNPLRERLSTQSMKTMGNGGNTPHIPRDLVVAIILVWLWMEHKDTFRRAFAKSGRIDVDPECKWLIHAAVDTVSRAIISELIDASQNSGPLACAMSNAKSKSINASKVADESENNDSLSASTNLDSRFAIIASEALMTELCIDEGVDSVLVMYEDFVKMIDETRIQSLRSKCAERVLLASIVAKYSTMPEFFSHAYVSSMVRAGEALGHGELFELVQDEDVSASTMIPYDIFSDETGAWEDPCRPINGFSPRLTGEDLIRLAHARAMIVKSLKKMQDRNNITGGTPVAGPYAEKTMRPIQTEDNKSCNTQQRASGGSQRRRSTSLTDNCIRSGTGSRKMLSEAQYYPRHVSKPLFWDESCMENLPYGKYENRSRPRTFSSNSFSPGIEEASSGRKRRGNLSDAAPQESHVEAAVQDRSRRSTEEIVWSDVANVFEIVNIGGPANTSRRRTSKLPPQPAEQPRNPVAKTIIAPFCNRIDDKRICSTESDSDEEDLSDEAILARHEVVLNKMKERLDKFMQGRTTAGQRARQRAKQRAAEKMTISEKKASTPR